MKPTKWTSKGKKIKKKNGFDHVIVYGFHGQISVKNQRYMLKDGSNSSYLVETGALHNGQYTQEIGLFIEKWSNDLSYEKISELLREITGCKTLTASGIQSYLERKAISISKEWEKQRKTETETEIIKIIPDVNLYEVKQEEVILMVDEVCVKAQKPHKNIERTPENAKRHDITIAMVEDKEKSYHYLTEGINEKGKVSYNIKTAIFDKISLLHDTTKPLPIVVITDGATNLRLMLYAIFGINVPIILDWYHLQLKLKNLMSMIACKKEDKECYINDLKPFLWAGNTIKAIEYLSQIPQVKNETKRQELITYLKKHAHEIIDYGLRKEANKTIGSGRVEKGNDLAVAHRQKKKGMAWSKTGSSALAIIKVSQLNQNIQ